LIHSNRCSTWQLGEFASSRALQCRCILRNPLQHQIRPAASHVRRFPRAHSAYTSQTRSARSTRMSSSPPCFLAVANPPKPRAGSPWLPCCSTPWKETLYSNWGSADTILFGQLLFSQLLSRLKLTGQNSVSNRLINSVAQQHGFCPLHRSPWHLRLSDLHQFAQPVLVLPFD
jgi:hypothetical protein